MAQDNDPQPPIDYRSTSPRRHDSDGPRIVGQAIVGAFCTLFLIGCVAFVTAFASVSLDNKADGAGPLLFIAGGIAIAAIGIVTARRRQRYRDERGWAIGIYIGLGLGGLFWGCCGFVAHSIHSI